MLDDDRASYLDRVFAGIARSLALGRRGDHAAGQAAFDQVRAAADGTEDVVPRPSPAWPTRRRRRPGGRPTPRARREEADRRLAELGIDDTGWRRAFSLALGISSAA